jgi:hypothetical protein
MNSIILLFGIFIGLVGFMMGIIILFYSNFSFIGIIISFLLLFVHIFVGLKYIKGE